jgi:hypothetical protein
MNPPKPPLRKEQEKRRANLPVRPLYHPPAAPAKPMSTGRWLAILALLAALGWCAGWAVSSMGWWQGDVKISGLDNLPTKSRVPAIQPEPRPAATASAAPENSANDNSTQFADSAFAPGPYRSGEVVIGANSPGDLATLVQRAQAAGGTLLGSIREADSARLTFPDAASMAAFLRDTTGGLAAANPEYNYTVSLPTPPTAPIDPFAPGSLRPFGNTVMSYLGVPANNSNWGRGITVAMLDTGLAPGTTNILTGTGGSIAQYDMTGSPDPPALGHGDMVVSLLAGANGEQGIVPAASLMSMRVLDANDQGTVFSVTDGIYTAVADGARVLNLSLGTSQPSTLLQDAINYALSQGVIVVAAAGNDGNGQISYPAAYPGVIAVGAVDATGQRATFSDYGPQMGITAPGVGINTVTTGGIMSFSGTSAAAPLVAGAIAGLLSVIPNLTGQEAYDLLTQHADFAGPVTASFTNQFYGAGVMDVGRVLNRDNASLSDVAVADMYLNITAMPTTATAPMEISIQNRGNTFLGSVDVSIDVGGTPTTQTLLGMKPDEVRAINVDLPVAQLTTTGVQVTARADLGQPDSNPANNSKSRLVRLVPAGG